MKLSDIVTITAARSVGRGAKRYYLAKVGGMEVTSDTKDGALTETVQRIIATVRHSLDRRYILAADGRTLLVVYHSFGGWGYDIIRDGKVCGSVGVNVDTYEQAVQKAEDHAASY